MKLNEEQTELLNAVREAFSEEEALHAKARKDIAIGMNSLEPRLKGAVKRAVEAGVPKRQVQAATTFRGTGPFYKFLAEAGVPVDERPSNLPIVRGERG